MEKKFNNLELNNIFFSPRFNLQEGQKEILKNIIEWKDTPPLVKTGRSTFLMIEDDALPFNGLKIKGCGFFDLNQKIIEQPLEKESYDAHIINAPDGIKEIHFQIEVNEKDELFYSVPKKRPYGGQTFDRAKLEFDVDQTLLNNFKGNEKDFPFYLPIGYAEYKDLKYNEKPLGVTILGMHANQEIALAHYFEGSFEERGLKINPNLFHYWQNHVSVIGQEEPDYFDLLKTLKKLCFEFGKTLSILHENFADFDSHFFNETVNLKNGKVILFDLDHLLYVDGMSDQKYFYYSLKDFEIGLTAILSNFLLSGLTDGAILFEELKQPIEDCNLIQGFYEGYFGNLSKGLEEDSALIWQQTIMLILNKLIKSQKNKIFHSVYDFCEMIRDASYVNIREHLLIKIQKKRKQFTLSQEKHSSIITSFLKHKKYLEALYSSNV